MSSNSSLIETAFIACTAAAASAYLVLQLTKDKRDVDSYARAEQAYPNSRPTFLQNSRTRMPDEEESLLLQTKGWSMEEALASAQKDSDKAKAMFPADVLKSLQQGNSRFWTGRARRPEVSAFERRALINTQFPSTAVLGCSDSRVPVEIVFDQGLGDMFVVRVAGNCLGPTTQASLDYAANHLKVKVLLVMGHEGCGAIKAAGLPLKAIRGETKSLSSVLTDIKSGLNDEFLCQVADPRARDREAVTTNVRNQVKKLTEEEHLMSKVDDGSLIIVGAFYEISSGIVDFFMQVSKDDGDDFKPSLGVQSRYNPKTKEVVLA